MPASEGTKKTVRTVKRYKPPPIASPPVYSVEVACPLCGHRAIDISDLPSEPIAVGMKCPNCNNIVHFQCAKAHASS